MQTVKEVMTSHPKTCSLEDSLKQVVDIMRRLDCGALPVVDREERVINMITDRDVALCMDRGGMPIEQMKVKDCVGAKRNIVSVAPEDDLHRAIDLMEEYQVRRLAVIDTDRRCIGIVAQADIARKTDTREVGELVREVSRK